jgi:hypothetical protein
MSEFIVEVHAGIGFEMEPVRLIEVELTYGDQRKDVILDYDTRRVKAAFVQDEKPGRTIGFRYTVYMQSSERFYQTSQPSFTSPAHETHASIIVIDPRQVYRVERPLAVAVFPFQKYPAAFVDLKAADGAGTTVGATLELNPERREMIGTLVLDRTAKVDLQYRVRHVAQEGSVTEGPWLPLEDRAIIVGEPVVAVV